MKKVFYVFSVLLIIAIIVLYFVSYLAIRILKAFSLLLLARIDLTIPLILGSIFNPSAAIDVILLNFIMLEPFTSISDIFVLYITGFSVISIILVAFFYKKFTLKKVEYKKPIESEFNFSYLS